MTDQAQETTAVRIRPDVTKMIAGKSASGTKSYHANDTVGHALAGLTSVSVNTLAEQYGIDMEAYSHLNIGQQRMAVGSRLRKILKDEPEKTEGLQAACESLRTTQAPAPKKARKNAKARAAAPAAEPANDEDGEEDEAEEEDEDESQR